MKLNNGFEYIFLEDLKTDIEPLNRLVAYLCLRYRVQARIEVTWMGNDRPKGFFDLFRNVMIVTNENDLQGLITAKIRVHPPLPKDKLSSDVGMYPIPDIPFEEVGKIWFVEVISIEMQHEQEINLPENGENIDFQHPLIKSLQSIGLELLEDEEVSGLTFKPKRSLITIDEVMKVFLKEKPGDKSCPIDVWQIEKD